LDADHPGNLESFARCFTSYVILKYVRPVIKRRDTQTIHCPAAPAGVIDGSRPT
jgi:hypothetical protein